MKWALLGAGLLTTSCAGVVGAGAAVVVVGAGFLTMTCYDRVSVTVTDRLTGTNLCDAKVSFIEGESVTEATNCYQAALATGHYRLRVERPGLEPFEERFEVDTGKGCKHAIQTAYVAMDRLNAKTAPEQIEPPPIAVAAPPAAVATPPSAVAPPDASAVAPPAASAAPAPETSPPAATAFPDAQ